MKELFQSLLFWMIFIIAIPLPIVGGLLFALCQALGLTNVKL